MLSAVKKGMSKKKAAVEYGVPRSTLGHKLQGRGKPPDQQKVGADSILSTSEENELEKWLFHLADAGFPVTRCQLLDSVANLIKKLNRPCPIKDQRPGNKWFNIFKRRHQPHQQLSERIAQNLTKSRASVTEESLKGWFREVEECVTKNSCADVLKDPKRIFNMDESAFFLSPGAGEVLVRRNTRLDYCFASNRDRDRECMTVLLGGNASGDRVPPMVIFKLKKITNVDFEPIPKIGEMRNIHIFKLYQHSD